MKRLSLCLAAALLALVAPTGRAQVVPWLNPSGVAGTQYIDNWTQLTQAHYGSTASFPGTGAVVSVGPDATSSYNALFTKPISSESGYLAGTGFYSAFSQTHLDVTSNALAGLKTLVFELDATTGSSGALVTDGDNIDVLVAPTLTLYNSGGGVIASGLAAAFSHTVTYGTSDGGGFAQNDNLDSYQWNLASYTGISKLEIDWQVEYHVDVQGVKLFQDDLATLLDLAAVPEPGTWSLLGVAGALLAFAARRLRFA